MPVPVHLDSSPPAWTPISQRMKPMPEARKNESRQDRREPLGRRRAGRRSSRLSRMRGPRPPRSPTRGPARGVDREVIGKQPRAHVDADLRQPGLIGHPVHALVGPQVGQERVAGRLVVVDVETAEDGVREEGRPHIGHEVHVGLDDVLLGLAEAQDPERHPRVVGRDRDVDRRAVADLLTARLRRRRHRTRRRGRSATAARRSRGPPERRAGAGSRARSPTGRRLHRHREAR